MNIECCNWELPSSFWRRKSTIEGKIRAGKPKSVKQIKK
jgi:hypothetical protein